MKSRVDDTEIKFRLEEDKTYGIMLSGGVDSAILFYLILKTYQERGWTPKVQPFTMRKNNESVASATRMLEYISTQFPEYTIPATIEVGDPNTHHRLAGEAAWKEIKRDYPWISFVFYGSNKVPPWDYSTRKKDEFGLPIGRPERSKGEGGIVYLPFLHIYKYHTLDLIYEHGQEKLLELARSCTERITGHRCGSCFQCSERAWAFNYFRRIDPGIG